MQKQLSTSLVPRQSHDVLEKKLFLIHKGTLAIIAPLGTGVR